jgi:hypothetical protein
LDFPFFSVKVLVGKSGTVISVTVPFDEDVDLLFFFAACAVSAGISANPNTSAMMQASSLTRFVFISFLLTLNEFFCVTP